MDRINTDAATRAAGLTPGTLNVWIQRRLLPGVSVGASGKRRFFNFDDVMHICIMSALVRLGIASPIASVAAKKAREENAWSKPNAVLTLAPAEEKGLSGDYYDIYVLSGEALKPEDWLCGYYRRPEGYAIVEIFRIAERVRKFLATENEGANGQSQPDHSSSDDRANDAQGEEAA